MDIKYLAGIFDGEGCVMVRSWRFGKSYTLGAFIVNTDYRLIKAIYDSFGGKISGETHIIKNHKNKHIIGWNSIDCIEILKKLNPYLLIKKDQAELALTFPINPHGFLRTDELIKKQKFIYEELRRLKTIRYEAPQEYQFKAKQEHEEMLRKKKLSKQLSIQGFNTREIGEKLGVSKCMVSKYLNN